MPCVVCVHVCVCCADTCKGKTDKQTGGQMIGERQQGQQQSQATQAAATGEGLHAKRPL